MANIIYNSFKKNLMNGNINLADDPIKVMLVTSEYTPDFDLHEFVATVKIFEVTDTCYTDGGLPWQNKKVIQDNTNDKVIIVADEVTWSDITIDARYAVIYKDTGEITTSPLARVTSAGDAEVMVPPRGIPWPSTTTTHFEPFPLLVFPTAEPPFSPVRSWSQ